jgi:hypothetical protein
MQQWSSRDGWPPKEGVRSSGYRIASRQQHWHCKTEAALLRTASAEEAQTQDPDPHPHPHPSRRCEWAVVAA